MFASLGALFGSMLSDIFGRRVVCNVFLALTTLSGFLLTLSPSFTYFLVQWSLLSLSLMASYTVTFIRFLELVPNRLRLPAGLLFFGGSWNLSRFTATLFAVVLKNWVLMVFFFSFWICAVVQLAQASPATLRDVPFSAEDQKQRFYHIFTVPKKLLQLSIFSFAWFTCGIIFFGFNLSRHGFFSDSLYTNMLFPGNRLCKEGITMSYLCRISRLRSR